MRIGIIAGIVSLSLSINATDAQSISPKTVNSTGGSVIISGNIYDYSFAEMTMVSTASSSTVIVTQGLLQPDNSGATNIGGSNLTENLQVFPNPASTSLNIRYSSLVSGDLSYRLLDVTGKSLIRGNIKVKRGITREQVSINNIAAATYVLEVSITDYDGPEEKASFKIEKLK